MQSSSASSGSTRYIVRATDSGDALVGFIAGIRDDPAINLVGTIPSAGPPHTVVVDTDEATIERLRRRHLNQLLFEPDRPLSLFD